MAEYIGFIDETENLGQFSSGLFPGGIPIQPMSTNYPGIVKCGLSDDSGLIGERKTKFYGITPSSSVTVLTVNQIVGPRVFPLEVSWKRAQATDTISDS